MSVQIVDTRRVKRWIPRLFECKYTQLRMSFVCEVLSVRCNLRDITHESVRLRLESSIDGHTL